MRRPEHAGLDLAQLSLTHPGHAEVGGVRVTRQHVRRQLGQALRARGRRRARAKDGDQAAAEQEKDETNRERQRRARAVWSGTVQEINVRRICLARHRFA